MVVEEEENHRARSSSIGILSEEQMRRVEVPGDGSCLFWAVALPYLIQVNNNPALFSERFERLFGEKELIHSHYVRHLINYFYTLRDDSIYDDKLLRSLVTQVFRHKVIDRMIQCEDEFYESVSIEDFKDMKNELFITDGTFRGNLENSFSFLIERSDIDLDKLNPEILDEKSIVVINLELDKIVQLECGDLLQRFKFRMYLESMKSCSSWGGNHEIEMMKRMLDCEILVNFEKRLVSVRENSIVCLFNNQQIHFQFFLIKAQFLIEFIDQNSEEDCLVYLKIGVGDISFQNSNGSTLLHFAAKNNHVRSIHLLINQGAETNIRNHVGQTPLDIATSFNSHASITALNTCILSDSDSKPKNIISLVSSKMNKLYLEFETSAQNEANLDKDASSKLKFSDIGRSELHTTAEEGNDAKLSLQQNEEFLHSQVNAPVKEGRKQTALHLAAENNRVKAVDIVLENKVEVDIRDENSEDLSDLTPLHYAAEKEHLDVVKLLIEKGTARIEVLDRAKVSALQRAVRFGQLSVVKYLVGIGADVNSRDQNSISVLSYAAKAGSFNIAHFLGEKGAEINATDENSITPLHHAAINNNWEIVRYLVERGADPNVKSKDEKTVLTKVVEAGQWRLAKLLIENGAVIEGLTEEEIGEVLKRNSISLEGEEGIFDLIVLGNSELLENHINILVEKNPQFLNDALPKIYEEIQLLHIPIPQSVSLFIESQIIKWRLFSDRKVKEIISVKNIDKQENDARFRIAAIVEAIIISEEINTILSGRAINEQFLFLLKVIVRYIEVLKNQSRFALDKIPWCEMQFCIVNFILRSLTAELKHTDVIDQLVLNKARLMQHLRLFKTELQKLDIEFELNNSKKHFPNRSRLIASVLQSNSSFRDLYEDYELLRDVYSLNRIESYLTPACLVDLKEGDVLVGEQVILRALQVTGECLKNTIESPNMFDKVHHLLITLAPKNVIKIVTSLRDSLSHVEHLHKGINDGDQSSLLDIQKDVIKLKEEIAFISLLKRNFVLETFFKRVYACDNVSEAKEIIFGVYYNERILVQESESQNEVFNEVVELLDKFESEIDDSDRQRWNFKKLKDLVRKHRARVVNVKRKHAENFFAVGSLIDLIGRSSQDGEMDLVRRNAKNEITQLNLQLEPNDSNVCENILSICFEIYYGLEMKDCRQSITTTYAKIYKLVEFEAKRVKSIDRFRTKMSKEINDFVDEFERTQDEVEEKVNNILRNISREIEDEEVEKQFLNKVEMKRKVFRAKNTLINYYSKVEDVHKKIIDFYDRFRDSYENAIKFLNVYKLKVTLKEYTNFDGLLSDFNLREIINIQENVFKTLLLENMRSREIINFEAILTEFHFHKLFDDDEKLLIDDNSFKKVLEDFQKNKFINNKEGEKKSASLINEIKLKALIKEIRRDLSLDESTFGTFVAHLRIKLKKGETHKTLFNDFSFSKCKTMLNSLRKMDAKLDSFGKLVKDASKEPEISKLSAPLSEFIASLDHVDVKNNVNFSKEMCLVIEKAIEKIKNEQILQLKKYFFEKWEILIQVFPSDKTDLELLALLKTDDNIRIAVEMLVLNLTETLDQLSLFQKNRLYLDEFTPVLVGKHLRNYLAHGDPLISIISTNYLISLITHFRLFQSKFHKDDEFYSGEYLIGKVTKENLLQVQQNSQKNFDVLRNNDELLCILQHRQMDEFRQLIRNSSYLKAQNSFGTTLLSYFAQADNLSVFRYLLLEHGLSLFLKNLYGRSALHAAVTAGSERVIQFLLDNGFDASFIVDNGDTLLHVAVQSQHLNIVKLLLRHGADIEAANNQGIKAIVKAVTAGYKSIITELINAGSDLESRNEIGRTLLHLATSNVEIVKILLNTRKVDINAVDHDLKTPLHLACEKGDEEIVRMLLDKEANVNSRTKTGETPLHLAAGRGHVPVVQLLLLHKNVEIDSLMVDGNYTPLHLACFPGHFDVAELLLKNGADFHAKNVDDTNALHIASWLGHIRLLDILFAYPLEMDSLSHGKTALHIAAESGWTEVVRKLYENGANIFLKNANGWSALHLAARIGNVEIMEQILEEEKRLGKSQLVNMVDDHGRTALHYAAAGNQIECAKILIEKEADKEAKDFKKMTPLHAAATVKDHADVFDFLLNQGCNVHAKDHLGWSALHLAAQSTNEKIIKKLIHRKVNVNARSDDGSRTALLLAAHHGSLEIVKLLLRSGADVHFANADGWSAVHYAALYGHVEILDYLLKKIAKNYPLDSNVTAFFQSPEKDGDFPLQSQIDSSHVNAFDRFKATVLEVAVDNGIVSCVKLLLEHGTAVNVTSSLGRTALHHAAYKGHLEIIKILLEKAATINARDNDGWTPLHLATTGGHFEAVKYLLIHEADFKQKNNKGVTALYVAADSGFLNVVELILSLENAEVDVTDDKKQTPLFRAARNGHSEIVRLLLGKNAAVNAADTICNSPLHAATFAGDVETTRLLLSSGAIVDFLCQGEFTPLHGAANYGHLEMAIELIKFGADVNRKNYQRSTPLHVAVEMNKASVVGYLLSRENIEVNGKDLAGHTPLHVAALFGFVEIAEMLVKAGAEVNCKSKETFTPLHLAVKSENCHLVKLLVDNGADVNAASDKDVTALEWALRCRLTNAVEILVENGANVTDELIYLAGDLSFFDGFMQLVERVRGGGVKGTALHKVIRCKKEWILKLMLDGIKYMHAQNKWNFERLNSKMNAADEDGKTPLISAAEDGYLVGVDLLLSCESVKVNERTRDGMSALHLSALNGHEKVVEMLISKRADANLRDVSGRTAFDLVNEKLISDDAEKYQLIAGFLLSVTD